MISICAWCGKVMGEKPPYQDKSVTHGICEKCLAKWEKEYREEKKQKGRTIKPNPGGLGTK